MSSTPGRNPNVPQLPKPLANSEALLQTTEGLRQGMESLAGYRGDTINRAVTFNDLIRLGLISEDTARSPSGASDFATNSGVSDGFVGYSTQPHTWTAKQTFTSADGSIGVLIAGVSKGVEFLPSAAGMTVKGVSNTGAGNQPLTFDGSTLTFSISGTNKIAITGSTVAIGPDTTIAGGLVVTGTLQVTTGLFTGQAGATITGAGGVFGAPTGGDKGAGTVNATGLYINGTALQSVASSVNSLPSDPTGTSSGAGVMMGLAILFTPTRSGKVLIIIDGVGVNATSGGSLGVELRTGTGSAPANGDATAGTQQSALQQISVAANSQQIGFCCHSIVSGLTVGTQIWADLLVVKFSGGVCSVKGLTASVVEL